MPPTRSTKSPAVKSAVKPRAKRVAKPTATRMSLAEAMRALEEAGTEQTRKTWKRHGAVEPMFGVSFAVLKSLVKRIGVDHELALALWSTKNHDARMLALKIADPARITSAVLDRWARERRVRTCGGYVAMLAAESPHGSAKAQAWFASEDATLRCQAWTLAGHLANLDETIPDAWFEERIARIETSIHSAPNDQRDVMNMALIAIGGRNAALRKRATAAAKRIGKVEVDHGDTACKTPDAATYLEKTWAHATAKEFASPAAQERAREPMRTRC